MEDQERQRKISTLAKKRAAFVAAGRLGPLEALPPGIRQGHPQELYDEIAGAVHPAPPELLERVEASVALLGPLDHSRMSPDDLRVLAGEPREIAPEARAALDARLDFLEESFLMELQRAVDLTPKGGHNAGHRKAVENFIEDRTLAGGERVTFEVAEGRARRFRNSFMDPTLGDEGVAFHERDRWRTDGHNAHVAHLVALGRAWEKRLATEIAVELEELGLTVDDLDAAT